MDQKRVQDALAMLAAGEVLITMQKQKAALEKMISNYQQSQTTPTQELTDIKYQLECIFFIFYRVQVLEDEVAEINGLIQLLSTSVATLTNSNFVDNFEIYVKNDFIQSLYYLLVIVQFILVCALQQTVKLYSRDDPTLSLDTIMDDSPARPSEIGNNLTQSSGSREGFDSQSWLCTGAKGFCCLVYAVFRQPEVDMDNASPADVEWFLHEASLLRGYSYIRLCIIPVLQALASNDQEIASFLLSILKELLENLVHIFALVIYYQENDYFERDFPYLFFPPSQSFYLEHSAYYIQVRDRDRHAYGGKYGTYMIEEVDSLEDILLCLSALVDVYPSFALKFWPQEDEDRDSLHNISLQNNNMGAYCQQFSFHPFVGRLFDISMHHQEIIFSTIEFLAEISNAPGNHSRMASFAFIYNNTSRHSIIDWDNLMNKLDIVMNLYQEQNLATDAVALTSTQSTMSSTYKKLMQGSSSGFTDGLVLKRSVQLTTLDMEALLSILSLLHAITKEPYLAVYFQQNYQLISKLFALLSFPLFIEVKREIIGCIISYAMIDEYRDEIWQELESSHILSLYSKTGGIRQEVDEIESKSGNYYLLDQFLILLGVLFQNPWPETVGTGYRVPGVLPYVAFVVDDVLLKTQERYYNHPELPSFQAQQQKIITRCFLILYHVIMRYEVHNVPIEELQYYIKLPVYINEASIPEHLESYIADFRDESVTYVLDNNSITTSKPKSPGYYALTKLLSNSRLMEFMMKFLSTMTPDNFQTVETEYIESELGIALRYFKEVFIISPEYTGIIYQSHHLLAKQQRLFEEKRIALADSKVLLVQSHPVYWLEYGCTVCLALMYEVSLRSHTMNQLLHQSHVPTVPALASPFSTSNYLSRQLQGPSVTDFAQILSNHQFSTILMQILCTSFTTYATTPSVYFYAIKVMKYLAVYHTTNQSAMIHLLSAYPIATVARLLQDEMHYLYHGIRDLIVNEYSEYYIVLLGSDPSPNALNMEYAHNSIRQTLLDMLLGSYLPKHYTYTHYFMGISAPTLPIKAEITCLDTLLALILPSRSPLTLLEECPYMAVDAYELLYTLCKDESSRNLVLFRLRQSNWFTVQFNFILYIMHYDVVEFYKQTKQRYSRDSLFAHTKYTYNVDDLRIAISAVAAYIFSIISLELVHSQSPKASVSMMSSRHKLMKLVFGYCDDLEFSAERCDRGVIVCNKVLEYTMSSLYQACTSKPSFSDLALVKSLAQTYTRTLSVSKASIGYSTKARQERKVSAYQNIEYVSADIMQILSHLKTFQGREESKLTDVEIRDAVKGVILMNLNSRLIASCRQVIMSSHELVSILNYASHDNVLSPAEDHERCLVILQHQISTLPLTSKFNAGGIAECLAKSVLAIISYAHQQYDTNYKTGSGWRYAEDSQELWCVIADKLVEALNNRQGLSDLLTNEANSLEVSNQLQNGLVSGLDGITSEYQGLICLSIGRVLVLLQDMKLQGSTKTSALNEDAFNMFVEQKGLTLCETLFPLVSKGMILWRLATVSAISNFLALLQPQDVYSISVSAKIVVYLQSSSMWSGVVTELARLLDPDQTKLVKDKQMLEYMYQLVLLGYKLGQSLPGGVDLLYGSGYLTVLCYIPSLWEVITMKNAFQSSDDNELHRLLLQLFNGIVQSTTMLVVGHPLVRENPKLLAKFLIRNHSMIVYLLRLQDPSTQGLQVLSSVLNLLLASLCSLNEIVESRRQQEDVGQELMNEIQDLLPDCLTWTRQIGVSFVPNSIANHFRLRGLSPGGGSDIWIQIMKGISPDAQPLGGWEDLPLSWSSAQQTQLESMLSIYLAVSGVIRRYSALCDKGIDLEVIGEAYYSMIGVWAQLAEGELREVVLEDDDGKKTGKKKSLKKWILSICTHMASNFLSTILAAIQANPTILMSYGDMVAEVLKVSEKAVPGSTVSILARQLQEELIRLKNGDIVAVKPVLFLK